MTLLQKINETIKKYNMISEGESCLVGLSGGADSVTLFLCLHKLGYNVSACHINHNLRGDESNRDQQFCESLCEKHGARLIVKSLDVSGYCKQHKVSVETGARQLRYKAFNSLGFDLICTAHTLSDSLETAMFNFARGTGIKGLCGIPPKRDNIIRPLIECTREEIEDFLAENNQDYVTDSTNLQDDYSRNRIRHNVIPELRNINSSLHNSFAETSKLLSQDCDFIEALAQDWFVKSKRVNGFDLSFLKTLHMAVLSRVCVRILEENAVKISNFKINHLALLCINGGKINLSGNCFADANNGLLRIYRVENSVEIPIQRIDVPCSVAIFDKTLEINNFDNFQSEDNVHKKFSNYIADYDKIIGDIFVRGRQNGDKIKLAGRDFTSSVKKLLNEKVPLEERDRICMLCDDEGLFFVEGAGVSQRVCVDGNTNHIIIISIS